MDDDTEMTAPEVARALECDISCVYRMDPILRPRITMTAAGYKRRHYNARRVDEYIASRAERLAREVNWQRDWSGDE